MDRKLLRDSDIRPVVDPFAFYLDAFRELSTCRQSGFGVGPIPFLAIVEYAKIYAVEEFESFLYLIRTMDRAYLDFESNRSKNEGQGNGKTDGNKAHKSRS